MSPDPTSAGTAPWIPPRRARSEPPSAPGPALPSPAGPGVVGPHPTARMFAPMPRTKNRPSPCGALRSLLGIPALLGSPALLRSLALASTLVGPAAAAPQDGVRPDQVFARNPRTGAVAAVTGMVRSEGLAEVVVDVDGKETKVPSDRVVRIEWGSAPPSFAEGLKYSARNLHDEAAAKFRVAAGDASARDVVQAAAQLHAAEALLAWGASEPVRFEEATAAAAAFVEQHPEHRRRVEAEMIRARGLVLSGKGEEGAEAYREVFSKLSGGTPAPGYDALSCLRSALLAARAELRAGDTLAARELFTALQAAVDPVLAGLAPDDPAQAELAAIQSEARMGEGFAELAAGNSKAALSFFQGQQGSMNGDATPAMRSIASLGLGEALLAEGQARSAQIEFARVSALDNTDRDRVARAQVLLARCAQKLQDKDFQKSSCIWLEAVKERYGDTPSAIEARALSTELGCN